VSTGGYDALKVPPKIEKSVEPSAISTWYFQAYGQFMGAVWVTVSKVQLFWTPKTVYSKGGAALPDIAVVVTILE